MKRIVVSIFLVAVMVRGSDALFGQDYPNKPIRIVTVAVGSGGDFTARMIADGISAPLGQPVVVDNRGGDIAIQIVASARPDGYTLFVGGGDFWIDRRVGSRALQFFWKKNCGRARRFAVRAANRRCRHHARDNLCAERLDWIFFYVMESTPKFDLSFTSSH